MKEYTQEDLDALEENILEASNSDDWGRGSIIDLKDLEKILSTFFERKIKL